MRKKLVERMGSLRFRLTAGMCVVLVLAVAASALVDQLRLTLSPWIAQALDSEPVQDGLVLGSFGIVALGLIWVVSAWSLRPLARASAEAARAGPNHPGVRISADHLPTEIRPLVAAVNGALDRLEGAYETQRRFTADAAHELRTPLSVLSLRLQRARAEGTLDWAAVEGDVQQMTRLVTQLLDLARKEQGGRGEPIEVNFFRIAREAAASILPLVEASGRTLAVDLPELLPVRGRADDLRDMVMNLLENALVHGAGPIRLSGGEAADGGAVLDVADGGPGVAPILREAVFERFRKASAGSAGTGLGLAIVREVALSHGGTAAFLPGAACVVRVSLPKPAQIRQGGTAGHNPDLASAAKRPVHTAGLPA
jgi:two-component system sensor histidine kinase QseC